MNGEVSLKDEADEPHRLGRGDSYLIRQDSSILWQVSGSRIQKSFFNVVELDTES